MLLKFRIFAMSLLWYQTITSEWTSKQKRMSADTSDNEYEIEMETVPEEACCQESVSRPVNHDLTSQVAKRRWFTMLENGYSCDQCSVIVKRVPRKGRAQYCSVSRFIMWHSLVHWMGTHILQRDPKEIGLDGTTALWDGKTYGCINA